MEVLHCHFVCYLCTRQGHESIQCDFSAACAYRLSVPRGPRFPTRFLAHNARAD